MPNHSHRQQAEPARANRRLGALLLIICLLALPLGACGKKAIQLDAPDENMQGQFPRVYPDASTDPKP
jgi:hypothetical protein